MTVYGFDQDQGSAGVMLDSCPESCQYRKIKLEKKTKLAGVAVAAAAVVNGAYFWVPDHNQSVTGLSPHLAKNVGSNPLLNPLGTFEHKNPRNSLGVIPAQGTP